MDVARLRALREFADRGSLTAAAAALHCTPSAVSQQLRALQAEVGVVLTEPAGRGLRLTDAGQALVVRADEVLAALARAEAELDAFRREPRGTVRLAVFPSAGLLLLPGFLHRAAEHELDVLVRDVDMTPPEVPGLLADYDVVITHRDEHAEPHASERLEVVPLYREPLDVALPPGHRLGKRRKVDLADLAGERWIGVDVGFPVDDVLRSLAVRTGMRPEVQHRINDFGITEALVAAGHGVALLPRYTMDDRGGKRLLRRPIAGIRAARHVEAVLRPGTTARPAVARALELLQAEAVTSTLTSS